LRSGLPGEIPEPGLLDVEDPRALQVHLSKILGLANEMPPGQLRRDALVEVSCLRKLAIELHHRAAADLKIQISAGRRKTHLRGPE